MAHVTTLSLIVALTLFVGTQSIPVASPQLIHRPYYGYNADVFNEPGYVGYSSLYGNYYSSPYAYSGLGWGYGSGGALYH